MTPKRALPEEQQTGMPESASQTPPPAEEADAFQSPPPDRSGLSRRKFIVSTGVGLVALWGSRALGQLQEFDIVNVDPLRDYPYRGWEDLYRRQYGWDKVVRSTHSANCTGSCSWKVYVRDGVMLREEQASDYPRIGKDLPDYTPRGCQKG